MRFCFLIFAVCFVLCSGFPAKSPERDWLIITNGTQSRIVGGSTAQISEHPHQGFLARKEADGQAYFTCGCSLIHAQWALTAAHCTADDYGFPVNASSLLVGFGTNQFAQSSSTRQLRDVEILYNHESFTGGFDGYDIALMKLSSPVGIDGVTTNPISLPSPGNQLIGIDQSSCYISGWGYTETGQVSSSLQSARVPLVTNSQCQSKYDITSITIQPTQICTGFEADVIHACRGDSGGPIACRSDSNSKWVLIGAASFGPSNCSSRALYSVYTRVSSYVNWINSKIPASTTTSTTTAPTTTTSTTTTATTTTATTTTATTTTATTTTATTPTATTPTTTTATTPTTTTATTPTTTISTTTTSTTATTQPETTTTTPEPTTPTTATSTTATTQSEATSEPETTTDDGGGVGRAFSDVRFLLGGMLILATLVIN